MAITDAVVLVPGFLGFERIGSFRYFAGRVDAVLRGYLSGLAGPTLPVVPVHTSPTDTLRQRQRALIKALESVDARLGHVQRLHLVGHSTGGVDAYLLTRSAPLTPGITWRHLDPHNVRRKIRSIISIASPHAGTCLALSALAYAFHHPLTGFTRAPRLAFSVWRLGQSLLYDGMAAGAVLGALVDTGGAAAYVLDVVRSRMLVEDLKPRHMLSLHEHMSPDGDLSVRFRSVVTLAGRCTPGYAGRGSQTTVRLPDPFFKDLYAYAAGSGFDEVGDDPRRIESALDRMDSALDEGRLISNPLTMLHPLTARSNDGLVNSARQLIDPDDDQELLTLVVGDHIDVMGYYPQWATAAGPAGHEKRVLLRSGILNSGSGFGDEQFFDLFRLVAQTIQEAAVN
jgi:hypothetical protein